MIKATQLIFCDSSTPHKNEKENDEETGYVFKAMSMTI